MANEKIIAIDKVGNKVRFYDPAWREMMTLSGPEPCVHELALSPDRRTAYVPLYGDGIYGNNKTPNHKVLVVDTARGEVADLIDLGPQNLAPHGMTMTRDGILWVTCDIPNRLLALDPASRAIVATFDNPGKGGHLIEKLPDESKLYVSSKEGPLGVFDLRQRAFVGMIPVAREGVASGNGSGSEGIMPTPDGAQLVAIDNDETALRVIDTRTDRELSRVPLLPRVLTNPKRSRLAKLAFSPDGRFLVVTSYASALAWVIDRTEYARQKLIAVAKGPMGVLFEQDGRHAVVSSHDSGLLTRIDLEGGKAVAAFDGGAGVEVMAWC